MPSYSQSLRRQYMAETVGKYKDLLGWSIISASDKDDEAFEKRIVEYFEFCEEKELRPTREGFCAACGIGKPIYDAWQRGEMGISERRKQSMARVEGVLLALLTEWSLNGNVNPAIAIFNLKNNYGFKDEIEHAIKPAQTLLEKAKSNDEITKLLEADAGVTEIEVQPNE